jgi:type IV pilus assembly protein PilA
MLRTIREQIHCDETGFTLIEILVIILIIGIMVAIAAPAFLGRSSKANDASARSDARNLVSQVDACYTEKQDYSKCTSPPNTGLRLGGNAGEVEVVNATPDSYTVVAHSESGNDFTIKRRTNGQVTRTCTTAGKGSCSAAGTW